MIVDYLINFRNVAGETLNYSQYRREIYFDKFMILNTQDFINEYNTILERLAIDYKPTKEIDYELLRHFDNGNSFFETKYKNKIIKSKSNVILRPSLFKSLKKI